MNSPFYQKDRQGRLTTALDIDRLVLLRMDGEEALSRDFEWRVEALSTSSDLDLETLLGTHSTVEIDMAQLTRTFDGIVCEAAHMGPSENGWRYNLVLRPWLHVAGLRRNNRIFHNKTVLQIVEEVLSDYAHLGSPHVDVMVTKDYPSLEYTVQYAESDADFIRRQLERFGISWHWRHEVASHTLVLVDAAFALPQIPGNSRPYFGREGHHNAEEEHFRLWYGARRITTGAVRLTEYNFKVPNAAQEVDSTGDANHLNGDVENYDWPGDYLQQEEGQGVVTLRTHAERGQAPRHRAEGNVASLGAGARVTLLGDDVSGATGVTFTCLSAKHHFRAQAFGSGETGGDEHPYDGSYVLTPEETPLVPERRTTLPRVQGPETAVVVGEGEIDCDEHGRILVRFHWDLDGANTMRVRVSQNWASKGWGGMVIPRIGMEVIVEHLRGDPDKPIVTGCVYNGHNIPPYALPEHKTRSTFKTDTHQGEGFNELRFEDKNRHEEIFIHAQKDRNEKTRNNHTERIDRNWVQSVGHNKAIEVDNNHEEVVGGNYSIFVGPQNLGTFVSRTLSRVTEGISNVARVVGLQGVLNPGRGSMFVGVEKSLSTVVGVASSELVGMSKTIQSGRRLHLGSGNTIDVDATTDIDLRAGEDAVIAGGKSVELTTGGTRLLIRENGDVLVTAERMQVVAGKSIDISAGQTINIEAGSSIVLKAPKIDLN